MRNKRYQVAKSLLFTARKLARDQRGLVTADQLRAANLLRTDLWLLRRAGDLSPVLPGVYKFRNVLMNPPAKRLAAKLWHRDGVFSHRTAAALHGLDLGKASNVVELVRATKTRQQPGYVVRRSQLAKSEVVEIDELRCTSLKRTLWDLAADGDEDTLAMALESAWRNDAIKPSDWLAELRQRAHAARRACEPWAGPPAALTRTLRDCCTRGVMLESALEVKWWCASKRGKLPTPEFQRYILTGDEAPPRGDFVYVKRRVIVETMGFKAHGTREAFEKDALRVRKLVSCGWTVIPITWRMLEEDEAGTVRDVRRALDAHPVRRGGEIFYAPPMPDLEYPFTDGSY